MTRILWAISGFRREVRTAVLLGYDAVYNGKVLLMFRDNVAKKNFHGVLTLEEETNRLSRKVRKESQLLAA